MKLTLAILAAALRSAAAAVPVGWSEVAGADVSDQRVELSFWVKQTNLPSLEEAVLAISDPDSERYGQHLSNDEVHALVAPRDEDVRAVKEWLNSHGVAVQSTSPSSDIIVATVTLDTAATLLNADFRRFEHAESGTVAHRAVSYELPADVELALDMVSPLPDKFPAVRSSPTAEEGALLSSADDVTFGKNTPSGLRERYSVGDAQGTNGTSGFTQAVTGFLKQYYSVSDFNKFQTKYDSDHAGQTIVTKGDDATGRGGVESMLDAEYVTALGPNVRTEFWGFSGSAPDNSENEPFLKWLTLVSSTSDDVVPKLFSTSYGEDEDSTDADYAARCDVEFQKAGARGISLLFASGDSGVASDKGGCKDGQFVPMWPAGSAWVTAVGGTSGSNPEVVAGLSAGGFSNRFPAPAWQVEATQAYITGGAAPDASKFNVTGRGYPDISAQAVGFTVVAGGFAHPGVAGTSCASPTAGGVFGLINDLRVSAGKSTLGFLNPFIYKNLAAFNDVTSGSNNGCTALSKGFAAAAGWDPATGVGTPDFVRLSAAVASLP